MERKPIEPTDRAELVALADSYGINVKSLRYLVASGVRPEDLDDVLEVRQSLEVIREDRAGNKRFYPKMSALARTYRTVEGNIDQLRIVADNAMVLSDQTDWREQGPMPTPDRISLFLDQAVTAFTQQGIVEIGEQEEDFLTSGDEDPADLGQSGGGHSAGLRSPIGLEEHSRQPFPPVPTVVYELKGK